MAIVHVVMKSSSTAPPSAAHAQYIARDGQYASRGGLELVESGNMPNFAQADPLSFWAAADAHERKNGRAYTELQIALPRELNTEQRGELAREATRELLGDRFAYTLAVHTPLAKDNIEQPHMHLMFSERVVDSNTQFMPEEQFFKRNGAKKDRSWNDQNKPLEVRERWVEMMNSAMERHGQEQRLDPRSWAEQGRGDLASLREEKTLQGFGLEAIERHAEIDQLRRERAELPPPHLDRASAIEHVERHAEQQIAGVQERESQELSRLDKLIERAKEFANEVRDKTVAAARTVGSFFGVGKQEEERERVESAKVQEQSSPPGLSIEERLRLKMAQMEGKLDVRESIAAKVLKLDQRIDVAEALQKQQQEKAPEKEISLERSNRHDFGIGH